MIIVVNAELPYKSVKDVLDDARRRPGEIVFSSSGIYGASHVPMEMLLQAAGGLKMRHLPTTEWGTGHDRRAGRPGGALVLAARGGVAPHQVGQGPPARGDRGEPPSELPRRADAPRAGLRRGVLPVDRDVRAEEHAGRAAQDDPRGDHARRRRSGLQGRHGQDPDADQRQGRRRVPGRPFNERSLS